MLYRPCSPIVAVTYAAGVAGFRHLVVGSAEAFTLFGADRINMKALTQSIAPAAAGNLVGGAFLFAMLLHGQVRQEMTQ